MKPEQKLPHAVLLTAGLLLPTLITWLYFDVCKDSPAWIQQSTYGLGKVCQFLLPLIAVRVAVDRKLSFHWPKKEGMWLATFFGIAVVALMFFIYQFGLTGDPMLEPLKENILDKVRGFGVDAPWKFLVMGLWYSLFHSLFEEYYWRWFIFPQCKRLFPVWAAIVISSLGFMLHHVLVLGFYLGWDNLFTYQVSLCIAVGGAFWAWLFHKTHSLYPVWLSHGLVDAGIFLMGFLMVKDQLI